jgi:4-hydroxybenzoyl-CoA reductase subunit beta
MESLPDFDLIRPRTLDEAVKARQEFPGSRLLGGGTDLLVNIRRGIGDEPPALIDMTNIAELKTIKSDAKKLNIGASVTIQEVASDNTIAHHYPAIAEAAASIAGPTQRAMGTVGGNLCLDTRCIYYNQSHWWRSANGFCLKYRGEKCHIALKSKTCFATYSGDLAPAAMIFGAEIEIIGPNGRRKLTLADLYSGDGQDYLTLNEGEIITALSIKNEPGLRSGYEKIRPRQSIDYPLAGVAAGLCREGNKISDLRIAITGTNPRPVLLDGTAHLVGGPPDDEFFDTLDKLMSAQIKSMKTTLAPGHYRRKVAGVLVRRLTKKLFENYCP